MLLHGSQGHSSFPRRRESITSEKPTSGRRRAMTEKNPGLIYPTPEEDAEINRQIAEDPDTYKWTDEDWAEAKTTQVFSSRSRSARVWKTRFIWSST